MILRPSENLVRETQAAAIALLVSIAIGSLLMLVIGVSPGHVWWLMLERTLGQPSELGQVLYKATALTMCGLAVALALDAGLFNIGAEGQLLAGIFGCALVGSALPAGTPSVIAVPVCLIAAAAFGGAVGWLIGALRVWRGAHEVITSIMLNAIIAGLLLWIGNEAVFVEGTTRRAPSTIGAPRDAPGFPSSAYRSW